MRGILSTAISLLMVFLSSLQLAAQPTTFDARQKWVAATTYVREGFPLKAIPLLEDLLTLAPDNLAVRLELALAYFRVNADQKAKYNFERALDRNIELRERNAVLNYLQAIEERRTWSAMLSFAIVPESNAANVTSSQSINLGGFDFILDEVASPGTGANINASIAYSHRILPDLTARVQLSAYGTAYEDRNLNDFNAKADFGLTHRLKFGREFSYGMYAGQRWIGDDPFSEDFGVYMSGFTRIGKDLQFYVRGDSIHRTTPSIPGRDGTVTSVAATIVKNFSPQFFAEVRSFVTATDAVSASESGNVLGAGIGAGYTFRGGWRTNLNATVSLENRFGNDAVFGVRRHETQLNLELQVLNRNIRRFGFTPIVKIGLERRKSNIALYSFENNYLSIGLTREF